MSTLFEIYPFTEIANDRDFMGFRERTEKKESKGKRKEEKGRERKGK